jgi:hypothetical protein
MLVDPSCVWSLRCLHMASARMSVIVLVTASGCRLLLGDAPEPTDAAVANIDAMADANTDPKCAWGGAGLPQGGICLSELPTSSVAIPTTIDTDTSSLCVAYSKGGGTYCVIAGTAVMAGNVRVTGSKPLVMIATNALTVTGTIDIASHTATMSRGAGTDPTTCDYGVPPNSGNNPETRGGAGGSFAGSGGRGGLRNNQLPSADSGVPGARASIAPPAVLRGGCHGQNGFGAGAAVGGFGGGAIYLVGGVSIEVAATAAINASGAGGNGGTGGNTPKGGAGAGSGGMIVLEAPTVDVLGRVFADGGGGGEGGGTNNPGNYGYESDGTSRAPGGNGGATGGSDGGDGSYGATLDGIDGNNNGVDTGGGGGGGAGVIWLHAPAGTRSGVISPAPTMI